MSVDDGWDYYRAQAYADETAARVSNEWQEKAQAMARAAEREASARVSAVANAVAKALREKFDQELAEEKNFADAQQYNLSKITGKIESLIEEIDELKIQVSLWKIGCLSWKSTAESMTHDIAYRGDLLEIYSKAVLLVSQHYPEDAERIEGLDDGKNIILAARNAISN